MAAAGFILIALAFVVGARSGFDVPWFALGAHILASFFSAYFAGELSHQIDTRRDTDPNAPYLDAALVSERAIGLFGAGISFYLAGLGKMLDASSDSRKFGQAVKETFEGASACDSVLQLILEPLGWSTCGTPAALASGQNDPLLVTQLVFWLWAAGLIAAWVLFIPPNQRAAADQTRATRTHWGFAFAGGLYFALHWFIQSNWIKVERGAEGNEGWALLAAAMALFGATLILMASDRAGRKLAGPQGTADWDRWRWFLAFVAAGSLSCLVAALICACQPDWVLAALAVTGLVALILLLIFCGYRRWAIAAGLAGVCAVLFIYRCEIVKNGGPLFDPLRVVLEEWQCCDCSAPPKPCPECSTGCTFSTVCPQSSTKTIATGCQNGMIVSEEGVCVCPPGTTRLEGQCGCAEPPPCEATIVFKPGSATPKDATHLQTAIDNFAAAHCSAKDILITGHGDRDGADYRDCTLAKRRAQVVYDRFVARFGGSRSIVNTTAARVCPEPPAPPPCEDPCAPPPPCPDPCEPRDDDGFATEVPDGSNDWREAPPPARPGIVEVTGADPAR